MVQFSTLPSSVRKMSFLLSRWRSWGLEIIWWKAAESPGAESQVGERAANLPRMGCCQALGRWGWSLTTLDLIAWKQGQQSVEQCQFGALMSCVGRRLDILGSVLSSGPDDDLSNVNVGVCQGWRGEGRAASNPLKTRADQKTKKERSKIVPGYWPQSWKAARAVQILQGNILYLESLPPRILAQRGNWHILNITSTGEPLVKLEPKSGASLLYLLPLQLPHP